MRVDKVQQYRRSSRNASASRRRNGPRPTRFVPRVVYGRKAGCGTASVKGSGSNGGIERSVEIAMFPVFPVLFPVCSQSGSMNSLRSQCSGLPATTLMDAVVALWQYFQTTRNTGNIGNKIEASRVGLDSRVERTWNTGTTGRRRMIALELNQERDAFERRLPKLDTRVRVPSPESP